MVARVFVLLSSMLIFARACAANSLAFLAVARRFAGVDDVVAVRTQDFGQRGLVIFFGRVNQRIGGVLRCGKGLTFPQSELSARRREIRRSAPR